MAIPLGNRDLRETAGDSPRPWHQETLEIGAQDGLWASMDVQGRAGLGWAGLCGAGDQPCCGNPGARAGGPRGADVGSWVIGALITNGTVILTNKHL